MSKITKVCAHTIVVKDVEGSDGEVTMEGWANKAVVDRGMDLIPKTAWNLKNFEKNPVMLFNHDMDKPIGKVVGFEARDEGLYVKCVFSKSNDPMVAYVRDMVKEKILNSFSVGFDAKQSEKNAEGVNVITSAELYEVSVVSIPMNQDSTFSLTSKGFDKMTYTDARRQVLQVKGAMVAAALHDCMEGKGEEFDKEECAKEIAAKAECTEEEVAKVLSGETTPVPEKILNAFAEVLGLSSEDLKALDVKDSEKPEDKPAEDKPAEDKPAEENKDDKGAMDEPKPEDKPADENKEDKAEIESVLVAIKVPKNAVESAEAAGAWAEENGFSGGVVEEEGDYYVIYQDDPEKFENLEDQPQEGGVVAVVGTAKPEEKTEEEDKPAEEETNKEEKQVGEGGASISNVTKADDNPMLELMRQMVTSLAMIVGKFDALSKQLESIAQPVKAEEPPAQEEEPASEEQVEELKSMLAKVDKRMAKLGL